MHHAQCSDCLNYAGCAPVSTLSRTNEAPPVSSCLHKALRNPSHGDFSVQTSFWTTKVGKSNFQIKALRKPSHGDFSIQTSFWTTKVGKSNFQIPGSVLPHWPSAALTTPRADFSHSKGEPRQQSRHHSSAGAARTALYCNHDDGTSGMQSRPQQALGSAFSLGVIDHSLLV